MQSMTQDRTKAALPPNVDYAMLRPLVFCREVVTKDTGVTLVDVHDTRIASRYPARYPDLVLYASFETMRTEPVSVELRSRAPSGHTDMVASAVFEPDEWRVVLAP